MVCVCGGEGGELNRTENETKSQMDWNSRKESESQTDVRYYFAMQQCRSMELFQY